MVSLGGDNSASGNSRADQVKIVRRRTNNIIRYYFTPDVKTHCHQINIFQPHVVHHHHFVADDNENGYNLTDNQTWSDSLNYIPSDDFQTANAYKDEVNGWQSGPHGVSEFQGSQTLPRNLGGSKTKTKKTNRAKV